MIFMIFFFGNGFFEKSKFFESVPNRSKFVYKHPNECFEPFRGCSDAFFLSLTFKTDFFLPKNKIFFAFKANRAFLRQKYLSE